MKRVESPRAEKWENRGLKARGKHKSYKETSTSIFENECTQKAGVLTPAILLYVGPDVDPNPDPTFHFYD